MIKRSVPSPAFVIACIALFVAMGGTGYAATQLVSGKEEGATASKVKRGPRGKRGKTGPAGPAGLAGPAGPAGPAGSARAWGVISHTGALVKGFNITSVSKIGTGLYCIAVGNGINTTNAGALATLDWSDIFVASGDDIQVVSETAFNGCNPNTQFEVRTGSQKVNGTALEFTFKDDGFDFMVP